ncbi:helix-turn-helix domain-containing protein [Ramlibacter sp. AN1133]|uniref:helix-turn-helix domain-containing protein n=1 Tax=Ramlibacter sp. AN1133 TaxID=3133429 RepID=UPI0030C1615D
MLVKDQIAKHMKTRMISVMQLADMVGVSEQSVRYWLSGRNRPSRRHLPALEAALQAQIDLREGTPSAEGRALGEVESVARDLELTRQILMLPPGPREGIVALVSALARG